MKAPDTNEIIDCAVPAEWESWLQDNRLKQLGGVWLRIAKKGSAKTSISISEALDIALCFGWIDSQRNGFDQDFYLQRYSPRRSKSPWSKINRERAEALMAAGRMRAEGMAEIEAAKKDGRWAAAYESQRKVTIPSDLAAELNQNDLAKKRFDQLDKTRQYAVILPLLKAATPERRAVLLQSTINKLVSG